MGVDGRVCVYSLVVLNSFLNLDQGIRESKTSAFRVPGHVRHEGRWTIGIAIIHALNAISPTPHARARSTTQHKQSQSQETNGHRLDNVTV